MSDDWDWEVPPTPPLFAACDSIRFYGPKDELFTIRAGAYGTGNGALYVIAEDGQPECKITVNMVNAGPYSIETQEDEFCVKVEEVGRLERHILDTGFFEQTGAWVDAGDGAMVRVRRYADIWRFKKCPECGRPAVTCPDNRAAYDRLVADRKMRLEAKEAIDRIKGIPKESL